VELDDVVLPTGSKHQLLRLVERFQQSDVVYGSWGFGTGSHGCGVSALFAGPSGTGKTMAASAVANELGLELYRVDLAATISKYIGETEQNLARIFDSAERCGAMLLFDEADALFGKRSEVRDSHDRYANIEVSYLLQRIEQYTGVAVLTSNIKSALDHAFARRLSVIVDFPLPSAAERAEIWRRSLPSSAPTRDLDPTQLARLSVSGGSIRNIALAAAFTAAAAGEPIGPRHVIEAARGEYEKLGRQLSDAETRGWLL
jgi:SpoVK/Ycf46/Vps4 family AAA+-type ATPase